MTHLQFRNHSSVVKYLTLIALANLPHQRGKRRLLQGNTAPGSPRLSRGIRPAIRGQQDELFSQKRSDSPNPQRSTNSSRSSSILLTNRRRSTQPSVSNALAPPALRTPGQRAREFGRASLLAMGRQARLPVAATGGCVKGIAATKPCDEGGNGSQKSLIAGLGKTLHEHARYSNAMAVITSGSTCHPLAQSRP